MATRTPKSKAKAAGGKPAARAPKAATAPKAGKGAKPKPSGKKAKAGKGPLAFEEMQYPEALDTVRAKQPSFLERMRQRRAEKAAARAEEEQRREAQRRLAEERQRQVEEEQRILREAQEEQQRLAREAEEKEREAQRVAEERKARAAAKRAEAKAAKEAAERAAAEEAERKAAERKARREQEAAEAARIAEEKAAEQEAAKARRAAERQRKREELEANERRLAAEQAERDAEAEVEARRLAEAKRLAAEARKAEKEKAREPEPDLEFEEASKPVQDANALVPAKGTASAADAQADLVAAELAKRRSKPIVVVGDLPEPPKIPKAPLRPGESFEPPAPDRAAEAPSASAGRAESQPTETFGFSIPEAFLLLANGGGWDERAEKNREGSFGGALAGAMVLELLMRGQVLVQRDRIVLTNQPEEDLAIHAVVAELRRIREKKGDLTSLQQMARLAKANRDLLTPFKQRLADKGLVTYGSRKHLGLFHRSWVEVVDEGAQERLQNRLRRAIAGGGTPEAASILLLGLLDATGLFGTVVPDEAADYNRKRLNGLLGGRDIMGYKVDPQLKALQEIATRAVLSNVRVMTVRG